MIFPLRPALPLLALLLILPGCSSTLKDDPTIGWSARETYENAHQELVDGNFTRAVEYFEKLEARYPFGEYAQQAQLETIYAYFKAGEAESAVGAADRFIKLHPKHADVDYAYYMRGLASVSKISVPFDEFIEQNPAERDPSSLNQAFDYFAELVRTFPDSRYTPDAAARMQALKNILAEHELLVADYYVRRGAYVAAVERAKHVVEYFAETASVPEALALMAQAYRELHMNDLAQDAERLLQQNYPERAAKTATP